MNKDQVEQRLNELMNMKMSQWPKSLYDKVRATCQKVGFSGGVVSDVVENWILENE